MAVLIASTAGKKIRANMNALFLQVKDWWLYNIIRNKEEISTTLTCKNFIKILSQIS